MSIRSSVTVGFSRAVRTPRLIVFAWLTNILLAVIIAGPLFVILDDYVGGTVHEETLMERMDQNWWLTFKEDHAGNPVVDLLDYSIMGAAPFLSHLDTVLQGGVAAPIVSFMYDAVLSLKLSWSGINLLVIVSLLGMFLHALMSVAFVAAYRGDYPPTIAEFLSDGAKYFGPSIRLSLLVLVLQALLLYPILQGIAGWIASSTQNDASEMTPFAYYMGRNLLAVLLFLLLSLAADYARVLIVLERRSSAMGAFVAGLRFVVARFRVAVGAGLVLVVCSLTVMLFYAFFEYPFPKNSGLMILMLFFLQQAYMIIRQLIRAATYACEVDIFQTSGIRS